MDVLEVLVVDRGGRDLRTCQLRGSIDTNRSLAFFIAPFVSTATHTVIYSWI